MVKIHIATVKPPYLTPSHTPLEKNFTLAIRLLIVNFMFQIRKIPYDDVGGWLIIYYYNLYFNSIKFKTIYSVKALIEH